MCVNVCVCVVCCVLCVCVCAFVSKEGVLVLIIISMYSAVSLTLARE